ncbi:molybdopterin-dependent oxidoreductase [Erythrobacter sp. NE805]|uniref:molybdopterin-dependent oxidoreductase n=1 Tax=Erythrobacter sp. NE805 TaxID=3389875 RepID=UPI00396AF611
MVDLPRRSLLAGMAALGATACSKINESETSQSLWDAAEDGHRALQRTLAGKQGLAPEYTRAERSPTFRGNGSVTVADPFYREQLAGGFPDWKLEVKGLVEQPLALSLAEVKALPQRTQITRHDCVEGWSAIGEWQGVQLAHLLDAAKVKKEAKFIVFRCADTLYGRDYYESIDMVDAYHPQTIIAHSLNGEPLPEKNGAPLRMRIERQLGYKQAKYVKAIEAVTSFADIGQGGGGFWEDVAGYQWYAGV